MNTYERNLKALRERFPQLVEMVKATHIDQEAWQATKMHDGVLEITFKSDGGKAICLKASVGTIEISERLRDMLDKKKGRHILLLLGFGLGDYPKELLNVIGDNDVLVVYEASQELFKVALQNMDLCSILESNQLRLIVGKNVDNYSFVSTYHQDIANGRFFALNQSACLNFDQAAYEEFRKKYREERRLADSNLFTGISRGGEFVNAFMANIPAIIHHPGVIRLKDLFKGRPAIIVSAGPSLEKNCHLLRKAKGRALIIAVDVVVPTLLPAGILPDLVVALEANRKLYLAFQDNPLLKDTPFLCSGEVDGDTVLSMHPGPMFMNLASRNTVSIELGKFWEEKGHVSQFGGSVAHAAFAAAEYMGATVIAFVGQDLSFEEKLHAGEVTKLFYDKETLEMQSKPLVVDIFGDTKRTMPQFLAFKTSFEKKIKTFAGVAVNATEGGVPIDGARTMRLIDFIDEYCSLLELDTFALISQASEVNTSYDLDGMLSQLRNWKATLIGIARSSKKIMTYVRRIGKLRDTGQLKSSPEAGKLVRKIEVLEGKVEDPILDIIAPHRYRLENYIRSHELKDEDDIDVIQEPLQYYGELVRVIDAFVETVNALMDALQREKHIDALLSEAMLSKMETYYKVGKMCREAGIVNRAVKFFEKAATEFTSLANEEPALDYWPMTIDIYVFLAESYVKQSRYYEAREILETIGSWRLVADSEHQSEVAAGLEMSSLINLCDEKIKVWEEQRDRIGRLLEKATTNYGSHLESGAFYFRAKEYEMAEAAYLRAVNEMSNLSPVGEQGKESAMNYEELKLISAFYGLANTYLAMGDIEKALKALDSASESASEIQRVDRSYDTKQIHKLLEDLYYECGREDKTITHNQYAVSKDESNSSVNKGINTLGQKIVATR